MNKHNRRTVARLVRDRIRDCHPEGLILEMDEQAIIQINGQWRIPISPSREPGKRYEYYEALTEVELDLEENEHVNVFLAPSEPAGQPFESDAGSAPETTVATAPGPRSAREAE